MSESNDNFYNVFKNNNEYFKIITLKDCNSCNNAKKLLKEFNLAYTEINADKNKEEHNKKFYNKYGKSYKFFPKIFLNNGNFIGGYKELKKILNNVIISLPTLTEDSGYGIVFLKFLRKHGLIFRKYILIDENETKFKMYGVIKNGMKLEKFKNEYIISKILGDKNIGAKIFDCKIINYDEYKKHISNSINCLVEYKKEELLNEKFKNKKIGFIDMEFLKKYRTIDNEDIKNKDIKNIILNKIREIHMLGIRHCDIHLQNIMINDNNEIKIIDFSNSLMNQKKVYSENITELIEEEEIENCDEYKNFRSNFKL
jgi:glutaredoxin